MLALNRIQSSITKQTQSSGLGMLCLKLLSYLLLYKKQVSTEHLPFSYVILTYYLI